MTRRAIFGLLVAVLGGGAILVTITFRTSTTPRAMPPAPSAKSDPVADTYFGTKVVDPYRWMEKPGSLELTAYLKAEGDRTRAILDRIPGRRALSARLMSLARKLPSVSFNLVRRPGMLVFEATGGYVEQLFVRIDGSERVLVDPKRLASGGVHVAITGFRPSDDGRFVTVQLTPNGSEPDTITRVYETRSGKELPDLVEDSEFGVTAWRADNAAFYYERLQALLPNAPPAARYQNIRTYMHLLGTAFASDRAVFGRGVSPGVTIDPNERASVVLPPFSRYALGVIRDGVRSERRIYITSKAAFVSGKSSWHPVCDYSDDVSGFTLKGDDLFLLSHKNAPRFRVLRTSAVYPNLRSATVELAQSSRVIDWIAAAADALYVFERENGIAHVVRVNTSTAAAHEVALPVSGTIAESSTDLRLPGFLANLESWIVAPQWFAYDPKTDAVTNTRIDHPSPLDFSAVMSEELQVRARDGVEVPLSIVHRRDLVRNGKNPTLLSAYGAYGVSVSPVYAAQLLAWFDHGGIFAIAHVRGGGEKGEEWHLAGKGATKINTIHDFIDCAKWLIDQSYTSPAKLAAQGGSAGGITIGGALTQAPDLFAAVVEDAPVSDQLRTEFSPNGPPNIPEFGSVRTAAGFANLYATSPVHHVVLGKNYPAVMLTTGVNDPRVAPWEAAKMTAALQTSSTSGKPILLRVDNVGGHGLIGATRSQAMQLLIDEYSFLLWNLGVEGFAPGP